MSIKEPALFDGVRVVRIDGFRSDPSVTSDEDMVRVVVDMPKCVWRRVRRLLSKEESK